MSEGADWREGLPAELKESPALKDFKGPADLAKSYVETKALVGASIRKPGPDAGKEAWAEYRAKVLDGIPEAIVLPEDPDALKEVEGKVWAKLGRPDKPEGYSLEGVEVAAGVKLNEAQLREGAAKLGLTRAQFKTLVQETAAAEAARVGELAKARGQFQTELGAAFEDRFKQAAAAAEALGFPARIVEAVRAGNVTAEEGKAFLALGQRMTGAPHQVGQQGGGAATLTPTEARAQMEEIMRRPEYFDPKKGPATHEMLKKKVAELLQFLHPDMRG